MAVGYASTITAKDGRMMDQIASLKRSAAVLERLGASSVRVLGTAQVANTVTIVVEAENNEALGRLLDSFNSDAEGMAIWADTADSSGPTASWTLTTYFDI